MAAKPTIVFIPGAWHTPAAFDPLLPSLHQAGYSTTAVSLPSIGVSPGVSSFASDVVAVRDAVEGLVDLGRDVIAVAHSYGGVLVTESLEGLGKKERGAQGLLGGVSRLIYIAAVVPTKELDTLASNGDIRSPEEGGSVLKSIAHDNGTLTVVNPEESFYHDLPPELVRYYSRLLRTMSAGAFASPITYEAYRSIPAAYLFCTEDAAIRIDTQQRMAEKANITVTETLRTSHSPFLSQPEAVVAFIRRVAEGHAV